MILSILTKVEAHPLVVSIIITILSSLLTYHLSCKKSERNRKKERIDNIRDNVLDLCADLETKTRILLRKKDDPDYDVYAILNKIDKTLKKDKAFHCIGNEFHNSLFNDFYRDIDDKNEFCKKNPDDAKRIINEFISLINKSS